MEVFKPPIRNRGPYPGPSVFLAGSIEMGKAEDWQTKLTKALEDIPGTIFNPRRDDWDSTWKQEASNPKFNEQVTWELDHLDQADVIALYFDPKTQSPISLLELGLHAAEGRLVVFCPKPFYRRGNVEIVCNRYHIDFAPDWESFVAGIRKRLGAHDPIKEDAPVNSTGAAVAGIGVGPKGEPGVSKKRKSPVMATMRRKPTFLNAFKDAKKK